MGRMYSTFNVHNSGARHNVDIIMVQWGITTQLL